MRIVNRCNFGGARLVIFILLRLLNDYDGLNICMNKLYQFIITFISPEIINQSSQLGT